MIIGIGGCSNSGKSRLAEILCEQFAGKTCTVLCQDDYVLDEDQIPNYYEHTDWEIPESIDIEQYLNDLKEAKAEYDIVICERLFVFWFVILAAPFYLLALLLIALFPSTFFSFLFAASILFLPIFSAFLLLILAITSSPPFSLSHSNTSPAIYQL